LTSATATANRTINHHHLSPSSTPALSLHRYRRLPDRHHSRSAPFIICWTDESLKGDKNIIIALLRGELRLSLSEPSSSTANTSSVQRSLLEILFFTYQLLIKSMKDDPFEHIGDIHSAHHDPDATSNNDAITKNKTHNMQSSEQSPNPRAITHRIPALQFPNNVFGDGELTMELLDPTLGYVKRATVVIPVDMMLDSSDEAVHEHTNNAAAAPTYSIKQSRLALYTAFPPPPIILSTNNQLDIQRRYTLQELNLAKQRLKRHSGFHGAIGVTCATHQEHGYADTTLSLNYQFPNMLSLPLRSKQVSMIGNAHCNIHLGSDTKQSLGGSLSSLDGNTHFCLDIGNPFPKLHNDLVVRGGILPPRFDQRSYTISTTRDFSCFNNPLRFQGVIMLAPDELRYKFRATNASHVEQFALVMTNLDSFDDSLASKQSLCTDRPKISVSLAYGKDSNGWYHFPQSGNYMPNIDATRDSEIKAPLDFPTAHSTSLKVDVKQQLSSSQTRHSFIQYRHMGRSLSLGTMITRSFSSSPFSRLGVGIRHIFEHIWDRKLWKQGKTWWLLHFERGDVTLCIPIAIYPAALTTWESCIRLFYASVASLIVDAIIGELLCNATSLLRVKFLQAIMGKKCIDEKSIVDSIHNAEIIQQREERAMMAQQVTNAHQNALKQRDIMEKQARFIAKRESEQCGLVIVKAIYGVLDRETQQWISQGTSSDETLKPCVLDATIQLQFWVNNGSLHMPAVSKKHMLGFFNILECISENDWISQSCISSQDTNEQAEHKLTFLQKISRWYKRLWNEPPDIARSQRDFQVVLSIRYKFDTRLYDVMFMDNEAVELPSTRSKVVLDS
jgi:hypothetical protein